VSGLLERLASRAVGETPVARPRVPALFERTETAGAPDDLELVTEETAGPPEPAVVRSRAADLERPSAPDHPPAAPAPPAGRRAAARAVPPAADAAPFGSVLAPTPPDPSGDRIGDPPSAPPLPGDARAVVCARGAEAAAAPPPRATVLAAPAIRPAPAPSAPIARADSATLEIDEPPAVHVHIGRLDVRANLPQPAARPPARREDERAPALSLGDYLRGKREPG
jgi:hypothetical protein